MALPYSCLSSTLGFISKVWSNESAVKATRLAVEDTGNKINELSGRGHN